MVAGMETDAAMLTESGPLRAFTTIFVMLAKSKSIPETFTASSELTVTTITYCPTAVGAGNGEQPVESNSICQVTAKFEGFDHPSI